MASRKKCQCGRFAKKDSDFCFFCDPSISFETKWEARSRGGLKNQKIPVEDTVLKSLLPIENEEGMSRFINELLRLNLVNYKGDYDKFLTQTLRVLPRLNDLMVYKTFGELRQLLEEVKLIKESGYFLTDVDYAGHFNKTITDRNSQVVSGDSGETGVID